MVRLSSASYFNLIEWGGVLDWKMDTDREMIDCTSFSTTGNGYKNYFPALGEHSVSANAYWQSDANNSAIGTILVFQLFVDYINKRRYECYGYLAKDSISVASKDLVKEAIDFKVAQAYYREG